MHLLLRLADRQAADRVAVEADARRRASDSSRRSSYMPPWTMPNSAFGLSHAVELGARARAPSAATAPSTRAASSSRRPGTACIRRTPSRCRSRARAGSASRSSGVRSSRSPLTGDANVTPSSRDLAQRAEAEHLEAAGVGEDRPVPAHEPMQPAVRARSPRARAAATGGTCCRGRSARRARCSSAGVIALTVPYVPTGMNTGVSTAPCAVVSRPHVLRRRLPVISNCMLTVCPARSAAPPDHRRGSLRARHARPRGIGIGRCVFAIAAHLHEIAVAPPSRPRRCETCPISNRMLLPADRDDAQPACTDVGKRNRREIRAAVFDDE